MATTRTKVEWHSSSEHVAATVDHAMMVLPEGERAASDPASSHRLFFSGTPERQAQMIAVVVAYMAEAGLTALVKRIIEDNAGTGELRGRR